MKQTSECAVVRVKPTSAATRMSPSRWDRRILAEACGWGITMQDPRCQDLSEIVDDRWLALAGGDEVILTLPT